MFAKHSKFFNRCGIDSRQYDLRNTQNFTKFGGNLVKFSLTCHVQLQYPTYTVIL